MNNYTQRQKQQRGMKGEGLITTSLRKAGLWNHKLVNAGYGTLFDKIVILPGGGYALEIKTRKNPRIEYSKITPNERRGMDRFLEQVGQDSVYIIGIWMAEQVRRAFLIPWIAVRDAVCSGQRGSINMLDFPELPPVAGGWDMECLKKGED